MIRAKLISSLDKCFLDSKPEDFAEFGSSYVYLNQTLSLQIAVTSDPEDGFIRWVKPGVRGINPICVSFRQVENVPSLLPAYPGKTDDGYIRTEPGLYPDPLTAPTMNGHYPVAAGRLHAIWVDIDMNKFDRYGINETTAIDCEFCLNGAGVDIALPFTMKIIPALLPDHGMKVTQWFHSDCLASYYNVPVFSERHWEIIENYMKTFVKCGNNMILTPIFTPPLDTHIGGERPTVQLVKIKYTGNHRFAFDFSLLDRWMDTAKRVGIRYFEISHFFTQWGASHAPKIVVESSRRGEMKMFGWDTDATGKEYTKFLRVFIPALLGHLRERGDDGLCVFHISDEPNGTQLEQYLKSKEVVADLLEGYRIVDALSNIDFYKSGAVRHPIPSTNHIEPFIEAFKEDGRDDLWTYYCCSQNVGVSNRLLAMYGARTRCIGLQFWKYHIVGFLQWGFNFYYNCGSYSLINPYLNTNGDYWVPSGDAYSVYPGPDGTALESVRINQFREGLGDCSALILLESLIGRDAALKAVEELTGEIRFDKCINDTSLMLAVREKIDSLVSENFRKQ
ncbi:MAG: DUF4091 domain-containing protein [Clostridia bacterium]|nr:DUF4091 domain-containing protein [Clostridia bacterium]